MVLDPVFNNTAENGCDYALALVLGKQGIPEAALPLCGCFCSRGAAVDDVHLADQPARMSIVDQSKRTTLEALLVRGSETGRWRDRRAGLRE